MLCYVMSGYAMCCYVLLCYVVSCRVVLCYSICCVAHVGLWDSQPALSGAGAASRRPGAEGTTIMTIIIIPTIIINGIIIIIIIIIISSSSRSSSSSSSLLFTIMTLPGAEGTRAAAIAARPSGAPSLRALSHMYNIYIYIYTHT